MKRLLTVFLPSSEEGGQYLGLNSLLCSAAGFAGFFALAHFEALRLPVREALPALAPLLKHPVAFGGVGAGLAFLMRSIHLAQSARIARKQARKQADASRLDRLTGLHSRSYGEEILSTLDLSELRACVIIDVRRFHEINGCFGYTVADDILKEISARIRTFAPGADIIARVSADAFVIVSHVLDSEAEGRSIAESLGIILEQPYHGDLGLGLDFAIGVAFSGEAGLTDREFTKRVDIALHEAKRKREGAICYYEDKFGAALRRARLVEFRLRKALNAERVLPFLQPILNTQTGEISGFEVLARWTDDELGEVTPSEFVPVAEKSGLVGRMTTQFLSVVCRKAALWPGRLKLSVNIAPAELSDPASATRILAILGETTFPPARLQLEVTESAQLQQSAAETANLRRLRAAGVRVVIDDFGTGYCSFERLVGDMIDGLKIDKSFVLAMESRDEMAAIVISSVGIAKQFGLRVTAEGVETEDQLQSLKRIGCDEVQGFLLGRPMPLAEAQRMVMEAASRRAMKTAGQSSSDFAQPVFA